MTEATREGVEVVRNERDDFIAQLAEKRFSQPEEEIEVEDSEPVEAEEQPEEEPQEEQPEEAPRDVEVLKVDGQEIEFEKDKIYEAGRRALQKETAADKRLEEATRLYKEAQERFNQLSPRDADTPNSQPSGEDAELVALSQKIQFGDEREAAEAIRKIQEQGRVSEEQIAAVVEQRLELKEAQRFFLETYEDIANDPYLMEIARAQEDKKRKAGSTLPYRELYKEIGDEINAWREKVAPKKDDFSEKQAKKSTVTNLSAANVKSAAPEKEKAESVQDVIDGMRKARGQE